MPETLEDIQLTSGKEQKMKDNIRESQKMVSEIIEEVEAEICDDYCRYSNCEGHPSECGAFEERWLG